MRSMVVHLHRICQVISFCCIFTFATRAQTICGGAAPRSEERQKITEFVTKVFSVCGGDRPGTYYFGPVYAPDLACGPRTQQDRCRAVIEFDDVCFEYKSELSHASELDGFQSRFSLKMQYSAFRARHIDDGAWSEWSERRDNTKAATVGTFSQKGDKWSWEIGPDIQTFGSTLTVAGVSDIKATCADIENLSAHQPPPPAADLNAARVARENAAKSSSGDPSGRTAPRITNYKVYPDSGETTTEHNIGIGYSAYTNRPDGMLIAQLLRAPDVNGEPGQWQVIDTKQVRNQRRASDVLLVDSSHITGKYWYGTSLMDSQKGVAREPAPALITIEAPAPIGNNTADFLRNLPQLIQQTAVKYGLPPHRFDDEEAYIANAVATCTAVTPAIAANVVVNLDGTPSMVQYKDERYKACTNHEWVAEQVRGGAYDKGSEIGMRMNVVGPSWRNARGIDIALSFHVWKAGDFPSEPKFVGDKLIVHAELGMTR